MNNAKKYIGRILIALLILGAVCWLGSIIKCEVLTNQHGAEFAQCWEDTLLIDPVYWKVLDYSNVSATVYYVSPERKGGTVLYFTRNGDDWHLDGWGPSWSKSGTADDLIWPYIR